jgi:hypothetical protein
VNIMHRALAKEAHQLSPTEPGVAAEEDIRARAYAIWEDEGRPEGQHLEHWRRAADEVAAVQEAPQPLNGARPKATKTVKSPAGKSPARRTTKPKTKA